MKKFFALATFAIFALAAVAVVGNVFGLFGHAAHVISMIGMAAAIPAAPAFGKFMRVTPQAKTISVNDRLGNKGIKNNQGTTFEVYDYVLIPAVTATSTIVTFFDAVNAKQFPFTNLQQNQLQVGETLVIQKMFFSLIKINSGVITDFNAIQAEIPGSSLAQFALLLDNNRIMKPITLARANSIFNPEGHTSNNYVFFPETQLVIPPQIQFTAQLQLPPYAVTVTEGDTVYLGLHLTGTGAILNLKTGV